MRESNKGLLVVISGPSGVGKGSIINVLRERRSNIKLSVSATTRSPRPGEVDGVHYFFIDEPTFQSMIDRDEFLEYMHVFNTHFYGTPRSFVVGEMEAGNDVVLDIDVQGAMKVRDSFPDAVLIFIAPPSLSELKERLIGRGTETAEQVERRFNTAFEEMKLAGKYDYVVVNDILDIAVNKVENIIGAEKSRISRNCALISELSGGSEK
ncbi:MAG: guanylate kinase [Clostridia bacterium]|nr:guanylate kinase [Clostridia bacterium]